MGVSRAEGEDSLDSEKYKFSIKKHTCPWDPSCPIYKMKRLWDEKIYASVIFTFLEFSKSCSSPSPDCPQSLTSSLARPSL